MISQAGRWTQTPFTTPLQPKKWNAHFLIMFNFWWSAGLVNGLEPHLPALSSQKNEMLLFVLRSTSDVGQTGQWTQTPSTTPLQPIKWNASFWIMFTSDDQPGWLMDSNNICHPSPDNKIKCSYFDYVQLLMNGQAGQWTRTPSTTPLQPKKWNASFLDYAQLLMIGWTEWWTQTPSTIPLQPKKMKCSFLDYIQLLMIGRAGWWTQTPSAAPLQPKKWNAHILIMFNFWWSAGLLYGLKPIFHLSPAKKWNGYFWITFNF